MVHPARSGMASVMAMTILWATACSSSTVREQDDVAIADEPTTSPSGTPASPDSSASASPSASETDPDVNATGAPATTGPTSGPQPSTTSGPGDPNSTPGSPDPSPTQTGPVTPEVVRIGVIAPGGDRGANIGESAESEPPEPIIEALVEYLNATGGVAGRTVEAIVRRLDQTDQSAENQARLNEELCTYFTEDVEVLLVVAIEPGADKGRACYAGKQMPFLEVAAAPDEVQYNELSPWLLPGLFPHKSRAVVLFARALDEFDFLTDSMGVVVRTDPDFARTGDQLVAELERRGGTVIERADVPGGVDQSSAQMAGVVLRFKDREVDRVVFWHHGGAAWTFFANNAEAQLYRPWYGISSFDAPHEIYNAGIIPSAQVQHSMGFGFYPSWDTDQANYPITPSEQACLDIVNERLGTDYDQRALSAANGWVALQACELLFQTRAALRPLDGMSFQRGDLLAHFRNTPDGYAPVQWPRARFAPDKVDGNVVYRRLAYDAGCDCFDYTSPWLDAID